MEELITRRQAQFIFHSFLYYELNENLISDDEFRTLALELFNLQNNYPKKGKYYKLTKELNRDGTFSESGYFLRGKYPYRIMMSAFYILWEDQYKDKIPYEDFVKMKGFTFVKQA